jgi:hypothetical protein
MHGSTPPTLLENVFDIISCPTLMLRANFFDWNAKRRLCSNLSGGDEKGENCSGCCLKK